LAAETAAAGDDDEATAEEGTGEVGILVSFRSLRRRMARAASRSDEEGEGKSGCHAAGSQLD